MKQRMKEKKAPVTSQPALRNVCSSCQELKHQRKGKLDQATFGREFQEDAWWLLIAFNTIKLNWFLESGFCIPQAAFIDSVLTDGIPEMDAACKEKNDVTKSVKSPRRPTKWDK